MGRGYTCSTVDESSQSVQLQTKQSEPAIQQAAWRQQTAVSKVLFPVVLVMPSVSVLF